MESEKQEKKNNKTSINSLPPIQSKSNTNIYMEPMEIEPSEQEIPQKPANSSQTNDVFAIKKIFLGKQPLPIVLQDKNGPCPLISIVNALLIRGIPFPLLAERINQGLFVVELNELNSWLANLIIEKSQKLNASKTKDTPNSSIPDIFNGGNQIDVADVYSDSNKESNVDSALLVLPKMNEGLQINPKFNSCSSFEFTEELSIFDVLGIELVHGWIVDPSEKITCDVLSKHSYNSAAESPIRKLALQEELDKISIALSQIPPENTEEQTKIGFEARKIEKQVLEFEIVEEFLKSTSSSQMTHYGLAYLRKNLKNKRVYVLFRHNHFSVLVKYQDELFVLCSDIAFQSFQDIVFQQIIDLHGKDTVFVNGFFKPVPMESEVDSKKILEKLEREEKDKKAQQEKEDYLFAMNLMKQEEESRKNQRSRTNAQMNASENQSPVLSNSNFVDLSQPAEKPSPSPFNEGLMEKPKLINDPIKRMQKNGESLKDLASLRAERQQNLIKEMGKTNYNKFVKQQEKEIEDVKKKRFENESSSGICLIS